MVRKEKYVLVAGGGRAAGDGGTTGGVPGE